MITIEYADLSIADAMRALVIEWHDANEAACCNDDQPPYCPESKAYAHGYLAAVSRMDIEPAADEARSISAQVNTWMAGETR